MKLTVITITAILMLMPLHTIGRSPLAFAQTTSTCSLGRSGTCFTTGHADGLNNPNSQCLPNNMDNSQAAAYCSGFYSSHNEASSSQQQSDGTNIGTVEQNSAPFHKQNSVPVQQSSGGSSAIMAHVANKIAIFTQHMNHEIPIGIGLLGFAPGVLLGFYKG